MMQARIPDMLLQYPLKSDGFFREVEKNLLFSLLYWQQKNGERQVSMRDLCAILQTRSARVKAAIDNLAAASFVFTKGKEESKIVLVEFPKKDHKNKQYEFHLAPVLQQQSYAGPGGNYLVVDLEAYFGIRAGTPRRLWEFCSNKLRKPESPGYVCMGLDLLCSWMALKSSSKATEKRRSLRSALEVLGKYFSYTVEGDTWTICPRANEQSAQEPAQKRAQAKEFSPASVSSPDFAHRDLSADKRDLEIIELRKEVSVLSEQVAKLLLLLEKQQESEKTEENITKTITEIPVSGPEEISLDWNYISVETKKMETDKIPAPALEIENGPPDCAPNSILEKMIEERKITDDIANKYAEKKAQAREERQAILEEKVKLLPLGLIKKCVSNISPCDTGKAENEPEKIQVNVEALKKVEPPQKQPTYEEKIEKLFTLLDIPRMNWNGIESWIAKHYPSVSAATILNAHGGNKEKIVERWPHLMHRLGIEYKNKGKAKPALFTYLAERLELYSPTQKELNEIVQGIERQKQQEQIKKAREEEDQLAQESQAQAQQEKDQQQKAILESFDSKKQSLNFAEIIAAADQITKENKIYQDTLVYNKRKAKDTYAWMLRQNVAAEALRRIGIAGVSDNKTAETILKYAQENQRQKKISQSEIVNLQGRITAELPRIKRESDIGSLWDKCRGDAKKFAIEVAHLCGINGESEQVVDDAFADNLTYTLWS